VKWIKSFYLHPWVNRFNLLYLVAGALATATAPVDNIGWFVLAGEALYLLVRGALDRSDMPQFRIRKLPIRARMRYVKIWDIAERMKRDLDSNLHFAAGLTASVGQVDRLRHSFLDLLLLHQRIVQYTRWQQTNYPDKIAQLNREIALANDPTQREVLQSNRQLLEKRQKVYQDLMQRSKTIEARLDTIENSLQLLSEVGIGLIDPAEVSQQVQVILTNVEDAETFVNEMAEVVLPLRVRE